MENGPTLLLDELDQRVSQAKAFFADVSEEGKKRGLVKITQAEWLNTRDPREC